MSLDLDPQLREAIYAQPDTSKNSVLQALLSRIDPNLGNGALHSTQELLSQLESTNPTAGRIARYLIERQEAQNEDSQEEEAEDHQVVSENSERLSRLVHRLAEIRELRVELDLLRDRNDMLAAALGACYLCWGEDPTCPICHGTGYPGFSKPDKKMFAQWVQPALHQLKKGGLTNHSNDKR